MKNKIVLLTFLLLVITSLWAQKSMNSSLMLNHDGVDKLITKSEATKMKSQVGRTYAGASVLSQGKFQKIKVVESGIYKLTFEDLTSMGIDPVNVRVFGFGGAVLEQDLLLSKPDDLPEITIWMEKGVDGIFNAGDYILFYAQGINRWLYDATKSMFVHKSNPYSEFAYYFLTSDAGTGKKIQDKIIVIPGNQTINPVEEFVDYRVYEKDLLNLANSGKEFYGETFNEVLSKNLTFNFPNPILSNSAQARLDVATNSTIASNFTLNLNSVQPQVLNVAKNIPGDFYQKGIGATGVYTFTPQSDVFTFGLTYTKPVSTAIGYLNFLEVNVRRQLKMSESVMPFQNVDYLGLNTYNQYKLSSASSNVQIWDITDPLNISKIVTSSIDGKITFVDSGNEVKHYIAIDPTATTAFPKPEIMGIVPTQNLHGITQADLVIITHPNFLTQAEVMAQAHRQKDNFTVAVVTTDQVYNEFSSGTPDATAYRWMMKMLYDRAIASNNTAGLPKYLLLFGRGSYDNRKLKSDSGDNLVLTYQADNSLHEVLSYVTDDYFTLLDDNEGVQVHTGLMDIGVGRFPVTTSQQATEVVNKTIGYMNNTTMGNWKNQLCFLADDGDSNLHMLQADSVSANVARIAPEYHTNKVYLDEYKQEVTSDGESYPLAKARFQSLLESGVFLLNYTGHGGASGWANEKILTDVETANLTNQKLPIWVGATADFMQFDVQAVSPGEQVLLNPVGGGIGILTAARPVYASQNFGLNKLFCLNLFKRDNGKHLRIGDVIKETKNSIGPEINKLSFIYMGDPAIKLNYADKYLIVTSKINESTSFGNDTLRANSNNTIQGNIVNESGNKATDFNGILHVVVYDKSLLIKTMNNHNEGEFIYTDRPNILFESDIQVSAGNFSFQLALSKDINQNFGSGRIEYYAQDNAHNYEAQGYFDNFTVGGDRLADIISPSIASFSVTNYPNPAKSQTTFVINYDKPETVLSVSVELFDISGRKIQTISGSSTDNISWDLSTVDGQKVKPGIYYYSLLLKTVNTNIRSKANKMFIVN